MMPLYRTPDGTWVHLKLTGKAAKDPPKRCCYCGWISGYLCDWKIGEGKTCDLPICEVHALEVGPDEHLCPTHQETWKAFQAEREAAGQTTNQEKP